MRRGPRVDNGWQRYREYMDAKPRPGLRAPEDLRPAQLGIVLVGRMIAGHVSATMVDLAQRGFVGLEEIHEGADGDWLLSDRRGAGRSSAGPWLLSFERTLLDGVFDGNTQVRMSELGESLMPSLNRMRTQLRRDAVRHGWLRRWGQGKRTASGQQLLRHIHAFRRELRIVASAEDATAAGLTAYAMIFGLASVGGVRLPGDDTSRTGGRSLEGEIAWAQGDRITRGWMAVCERMPARAGSSWMWRPDDLAHGWSAPHGHGGGHGHGSGHVESYGGYDGHSGHFGGGGHSGH